MSTLFHQSERYSRNGDPDTSWIAGEAAKETEGEVGRKALEVLVAMEDHGADGGTVHEVAMRWAYDEVVPAENSISRRFTTLYRKGHVLDSGDRRMGGRGKPQIVWTSTAAGRDWLKENSCSRS